MIHEASFDYFYLLYGLFITRNAEHESNSCFDNEKLYF